MSTRRYIRSQTSTKVVLASEDPPPLIQACVDGNQELLKELFKDPQLDLDQRADIWEDRKKHEGVTALFCASLMGHHDVVKLLADHGADVNYKSQENWTPLTAACRRNYLDVAKVLIEKGADVNCTVERNETHLSCACIFESLEIVKYLVENGADVNYKARSGTPLYTACMLCSWEMAIYLIDNGADVNCKTNGDWTLLHWTCSNGYFDIIKHLIKNGADINCRLLSIKSPLHRACYGGHLEVVKYLVENGADVNLIKADESPLYVACDRRHYEIAKHLIDKGADVNFQQHNHTTCLMISHTTCLIRRLLLQKGADPHMKDHHGRTALYCAIYSADVDSVKLLIEYNASINFKVSGMAPLHIVLKRMDFYNNCYSRPINERTRLPQLTSLISILQQLLEHGAYPVAMDHKGLTPLDMLRHSLSSLCRDDKETVREILRSYLPGRLMSLAAQCIRKRRVSYRGLVPGRIVEFIELH